LWGDSFNYHILSVGSLTPQKNYHLLIKAFSKISKKLNAKLVILGEGKLRPSLQSLILELGLKDKVLLAGFADNPYPWYLTADVYVLSSDWEGLPTVLIEALESGLPIVSTDCESGPKEILENGRYGKLVPMNDINAMSDAITISLSEYHDKEFLMRRARDFSIENISKQYLEYFGLIEE
jgi:glycosyltransferase involved in cell wall biosynthesis